MGGIGKNGGRVPKRGLMGARTPLSAVSSKVITTSFASRLTGPSGMKLLNTYKPFTARAVVPRAAYCLVFAFTYGSCLKVAVVLSVN